MTDSKEIYDRAEKLCRRFDTRNPEEIAKSLGIVIYDNLETEKLLGMYVVRWKHRMIFVKQNLSRDTRRLVIAHELGHDQQHRELASEGLLQEFTLFNMKNRTEYEANAFAAHILLPTEDVLACLEDGYDAVQAASALSVDINLLLIKVMEMNKLGFHLRVPVTPDSCFLAHVAPTEE